MPIVTPTAGGAVPTVSTIASVNTFADVRLLGAGVFPVIEVLGGTTVGDGQDGVFYWKSTSVAADDGFAVLAPSAGGTGRWIRIYGAVVQFGTGAVSRTIQDKLRDIINAKDFGVVADGVTIDAAALALATTYAASIGGELRLPAGIINLGTTTWILKNKVKYIGAGTDILGVVGTVIKYTGTSDAIQINNPINSSTTANILMEDLAVLCTTKTSGKGCIADTGSTLIEFRRIQTSGNDYGLILDQTELGTVERCDFENGSTASAGVWLVNGATRTLGATGFFTNRITVRECQFNGSAGVGIADDGGTTHSFIDNNYNAVPTAIRATDVNGLKIDGGEFECVTSIAFKTTMLGGSAGAACTTVSVRDASLINAAASALITFDAASVTSLTTANLHVNNGNAGGSLFSGLAAGVTNYFGYNNVQVGSGSASVGNTVTGDSTQVTIGSTASFGSATGVITGKWAVNTNFAFWQNVALSIASGNYALIQLNDGSLTALNAPTGGTVAFRLNNANKAFIDANGLQLSATRLQGAQGGAVASANNLTLGSDGNRFQISGTTQINLIDNTSWQGGATVTLHFQGSVTVKHNQAASGNNKPIKLSGSVDFSAAVRNQLTLQYDTTDSIWYEIARVVA